MAGEVEEIRVIEAEIPERWERTTFRQLLKEGSLALVQDGNHGGAYPKPSEFEASGIPLITGADLNDGAIDFRGCKFLKPESAKRLRIGFAKRGDVLLTHKGTMGKTAIVPEIPWPYIILNPQLTLYRVADDSRLNKRYLKFFFDGKPFQEFLDRISGISTISTLSLTVQKSLEIPLPPLAEQKAIAGVLGALDDKIELNRRMNATLEAMARALFQSWFVDFYPVRAKLDGGQPPGLDPATAALFPDSFKDSELGEIPHGWRVGRLGELVELYIDRVDATPANDGKRYIALEDMPSRSIDLSGHQRGSAVNSSITAFRKGDVLFGSMRPYFHKVGLAFFEGITRTTTFVLRPRKDCVRHFALLHFFSDDVVAYATTASVGTTIPYVKWDSLESYSIPIPPDSLLAAFEGAVSPLVQRIAAQGEESRTLATLRDTLLPKLLSGALEVRP